MADTVTRISSPAVVPTVRERVAELNARIAAKGLGEPVILTVGETRWVKDDLGFDVPLVDLTITAATVALPGGWSLVGVIDFASADTPLVFELEDGLALRDGVIDPGRCDACGVARRRATSYAVRSAAGELAVVGSTCVRDFLGIDPATLLWFSEVVGSLDDEEFYSSGPDPFVPTATFVAAARAAVLAAGWVKASDWDRRPTKALTADVLFARRIEGDDELIEARRLFGPETSAFAADAIAWAAAIEPRSDFDENLKAVASSETVGPRAFGIAAYLPVAYARHLDDEAGRAAVKAAEAAGEIEPVPTGRVTVTGEVIGISERYSDYGVTIKLTVLDDRGFKVWVTRPRAIDDAERGDRVTFDATVEPSRDDEFFGFGKRPTKARILQAA